MAVNAQADAQGMATERGMACGVDKPNPPCMPEISTGHCLPISTRAPANPGKDWFDSDECAAILAQHFEPETENPFAYDCEPEPEMEA